VEVGSGRYEEGKGEKDGELHAFRVESAKTALQGRGGEGRGGEGSRTENFLAVQCSASYECGYG